MSTVDEGGPASEKTLRDWFAGQALVGCIAASELYAAQLNRTKSKMPLEDFITQLAYLYADEMIKQRAKR